MTGSDEYSNTRPISVAELLAKNGTIGAPPVGGRRRRRRGNADAVTVAELTGEIPIVRPDEPAPTRDEQQVEQVAQDDQDTVTGNGEVVVAEPETEPEPEPEPQADVETEPEAQADTETEIEAEAESDTEADELADAAEVTEADDELVEFGDVEPEAEDRHEDEDEYADAVAEYAAHVEHRDAEADPVEFVAPPRRSPFGRFGRKNTAAVDAELMSPDPIDAEAEAEDAVDDLDEAPVAEQDTEVDAAALDTDEDTDTEDTDTETDSEDDELPSYLRSTADPLFGGETVADDVARRGARPAPEDLDLDEEDEEEDQPREMSPLVHGLWVVGQSVVAVVFGAGLFVAFDQLWKWNNIVALVLSVLVILGLVVGVRVVRKTEDIGSTLIAVAVGALVTLGPLALLQSG
ncbi:hypothetical protein [Mycolicibacterium chlorophenolicum]|uniref:Transmembrane protein n=1 Tax=Mycolicibacterium chlorophenolicum TaxID=37916 RepID=A0A0J6W351_9MYCO|nr:hypothetical protein [Mycolicibacterium chlorophenolicum]KMO76834.1 hypothetical protein MCHLDSM_02983 [Mycolicibacterium chlorophenolicum]